MMLEVIVEESFNNLQNTDEVSFPPLLLSLPLLPPFLLPSSPPSLPPSLSFFSLTLTIPLKVFYVCR